MISLRYCESYKTVFIIGVQRKWDPMGSLDWEDTAMFTDLLQGDAEQLDSALSSQENKHASSQFLSVHT